MDAFIAFCESGGVDATDYQLIIFFGITPAALEEYRAENKLNDDSKTQIFADALKKLELYREDAAIRRAVGDPKLISHCALRLRQPRGGNWSDKPDAAQDVRVRLNMGDGDRELTE
jgi:hypothetical protein